MSLSRCKTQLLPQPMRAAKESWSMKEWRRSVTKKDFQMFRTEIWGQDSHYIPGQT